MAKNKNKVELQDIVEPQEIKYVIDLKGLNKANVSVGGCVIELLDGQEVSEVMAGMIPKFIKVVGATEVPEVQEIKEELLIEEPSQVEVEVQEIKDELSDLEEK